jgi:hypothetical protein
MLLPAIHYIASSHYYSQSITAEQQQAAARRHQTAAHAAAAAEHCHTATNYLDVIRDAVGPGQARL